MNAADELGLIVRARKGDARAFLALVRHYHRPLYRLAFALTHDVREAVSVTHETVVLSRERIRSMADGERFFPWAARSARSLVRARRRAGPPDGAAAAGDLRDPNLVELSRHHRAALEALDPDEQAALILCLVERMPYGQIEKVLRLGRGDALPLLARARDRIVDRVGGEARAA
jgi:RNA polymerase sigma-70 factor, ECF subfamily